ncbi:MAG: hypothetical protein HGA26_00825 [Chlorobiaceae bacterium]|nr:hypothetical protein [Chlorobiaceae bacterium]
MMHSAGEPAADFPGTGTHNDVSAPDNHHASVVAPEHHSCTQHSHDDICHCSDPGHTFDSTPADSSHAGCSID